MRVHFGLSAAERSELFLRLNGEPAEGSRLKTRRAVVSHDKYRVGIAAGREAPTGADAVIRSFGLTLGREGHHDIRGVDVVLAAYARGTLAKTLSVLTQWEAYSIEGNTSVFAGPLLSAVSNALGLYGDSLDPVVLVSELNLVGPERLTKAIKRAYSTSQYAPSQKWIAAVAVIRNVYNTHRNGRSKLPSPESILAGETV